MTLSQFPPDILHTVVNNAIRFWAQRQLPSGEYQTYIAHQRQIPLTARGDSSIFTTTCVVYASEFVSHPEIPDMRNKALNFLKHEMLSPGVWKYWSTHSRKAIDPDLDDTACVSFVLRRASPTSASPANDAIFLRNRNADGLFQTWIRDSGSRNDIDSVVNANVLLYLGERPETRPVCAYLNQLILHGQEADSFWYYADVLFVYYAISRAYFHGVSSLSPCLPDLRRQVWRRQQADGSFGPPLLTGLALSTLLHVGTQNDAAMAHALRALIDTQQADGSWERAAAFTGPEAPLPRSVYFGSEELTTAFCVEAVAKYQRRGVRKG